MTMERDIKSAVDYLFRLVSTSLDVPEDAMRTMIEERVRMIGADAIRWQAGAMQTAANNLTVRR